MSWCHFVVIISITLALPHEKLCYQVVGRPGIMCVPMPPVNSNNINHDMVKLPRPQSWGTFWALAPLYWALFPCNKNRHQPPTNQPTNRMVVLGGFWTKSLMSNQHTPASKYGGHRVLVLLLPFSKKDQRGRFLDLRENLNSKALKLLWAFEPPKRL